MLLFNAQFIVKRKFVAYLNEFVANKRKIPYVYFCVIVCLYCRTLNTKNDKTVAFFLDKLKLKSEEIL